MSSRCVYKENKHCDAFDKMDEFESKCERQCGEMCGKGVYLGEADSFTVNSAPPPHMARRQLKSSSVTYCSALPIYLTNICKPL